MIQLGFPKDSPAIRALRLMDLVCAEVTHAYTSAIGFLLDRGVPAVVLMAAWIGLLLATLNALPHWLTYSFIVVIGVPYLWTLGRMWSLVRASKR